jgi:hypothetical protein
VVIPNLVIQWLPEIGSKLSNKGYIIEAGDLVYVSVRVTSGDAAQTKQDK